MSNDRIEQVVSLPIPDIIVQQSTDAGRKHWAQYIQCWTLFLEKNAQYGNSIEETGVLGAVVELVAKNARLRQLVLRDDFHGRKQADAVRDTFRDLVNYGLIGLMMLEDDNFDGREQESE